MMTNLIWEENKLHKTTFPEKVFKMGNDFENGCRFTGNFYPLAALFGSPDLYQSRNCRWAKFVLTIILELLTLNGYVMTPLDERIKERVGADWSWGHGDRDKVKTCETCAVRRNQQCCPSFVKGRQYHLAFRQTMEVHLEYANRCCFFGGEECKDCKCWIGDQGSISKDPLTELTRIVRIHLDAALSGEGTVATVEKVATLTAILARIDTHVTVYRARGLELVPVPTEKKDEDEDEDD